jgi:fluoride ion exporter CrcB/FEX
VIGFISGSSAYLIDYEQLKIVTQFIFNYEFPTGVCFVNGLGIILISTSKGMIHVLELDKELKHLMKIKAC